MRITYNTYRFLSAFRRGFGDRLGHLVMGGGEFIDYGRGIAFRFEISGRKKAMRFTPREPRSSAEVAALGSLCGAMVAKRMAKTRERKRIARQRRRS